MTPQQSQEPQPHTVQFRFSSETLDGAEHILNNPDLGVHDREDPSTIVDNELAKLASGGVTAIEVSVNTPETDVDALIDGVDIVESLRLATRLRINKAREKVRKLRGTYNTEPIMAAESNTQLNNTEIVERFEKQHVVKHMPRFIEQVNDSSRNTTFRSEILKLNGRKKRGQPSRTQTEHEGLRNLWTYVHDFKAKYIDNRYEARRDLALDADSLLTNLNFVGKKEYEEAAKGLGESWKAYLDEDPLRKLCVLTEVGALARYKDQRKSDEYLRDNILNTFSEEELEKYSGRIVGKMSDLGTSNPTNSKIVMLDDWVVSGQQMRTMIEQLQSDPTYTYYAENDAVELNLIVATKKKIEQGLQIHPLDPTKGSLPIRSYFLAHHGPRAGKGQSAHITGLHSSVNFDFENVLNKMITINGVEYEGDYPTLMRVIRPYRDQEPMVLVSETALVRRPDLKEKSNE